MKGKAIIKTIGTYFLVGAASVVGAALWTNVLEDKFRNTKERTARPKANNVIDFRKAKKRMSR